METFDPIEHPSPITEFEISVVFPIFVPLPMTVKGPICAERDCPISEEKLVYQITHNEIEKRKPVNFPTSRQWVSPSLSWIKITKLPDARYIPCLSSFIEEFPKNFTSGTKG